MADWKSTPRRVLFAAVMLAVVSGCGVFKKTPSPPTTALSTAEAKTDPKDALGKLFAIEDARQTFLKNAVVGDVLVIEGKVVNKSPGPKDLIKVRAELLGEKCVVLAVREQVIGNKAGLSQLTGFSQQDLEAILNDEVGVFMTNINTKPGGSAPFMIVFYNPPAEVKEFQIRVVDAKDPDQD